jgi:hypothetical protein
MIISVGRTIPSYRIATEIERDKWKLFRQKLNKKDRKIFDQMFSYSRLYISAGSNACMPILIHPVLMFTISENYKRLTKLQNDIIYKQRITNS